MVGAATERVVRMMVAVWLLVVWVAAAVGYLAMDWLVRGQVRRRIWKQLRGP